MEIVYTKTGRICRYELVSNTDRREWMISIKDKMGLDFEFWDATTPDEITDEIKGKLLFIVSNSRPLLTSQILIVLSLLPLANKLPSGLKFTHLTG